MSKKPVSVEATPVTGQKKVSRIGVAAGATTLALLAAACSPHEKTPTENARTEAAKIIAQRYACKVVSVEDAGPATVAGISNRGERNAVTVTVNLQDTPEAQMAMAPYNDSNSYETSVVWRPPQGDAFINNNPPSGTPVQTDTRSIGGYLEGIEDDGTDWQGNGSFTLYPYNNYPAGTTMDVIVSTEAQTNTPDNKRLITDTGHMACGVLEFDGQQWVLSSQQPQFVEHVDTKKTDWQ